MIAYSAEPPAAPACGSPGPPGPAPGPDGRDVLVHRAVVYQSRHELALTAVPYLREGGRAGDPLVVIASPPVAGLVREQLGPATAAPVEFIDAADWFGGPMQALASYHDRMRADWWPRGRVRLLAEPGWAGRTPLETREWKRHEAILNVVFAGTPTSIMCAYDASALPGHVLGDAARTHPELAGPDGPRPSPRFTDPADFYAECNAGPLSPPPATASRRAFAAGELPGLRAFLEAEAGRLGLPADRTLPFVLAANEVATDVIREGGGRGVLWVWAEAGTLLCDVGDPGRALADRFLGYTPPRGRGRRSETAMWAVRRLCHIVEIRSGVSGTRVRLHVRLG
ncbi:sensor histidine kinase [Actinomadura roseirufa]|uniref:sensor histidine kinase n=1 Tax=Actinomadura roseirufa TaxID=2094049 RepID=UPI0010413FBB|nr:sensor histidine kinase [Actinomadura roseirufa]